MKEIMGSVTERGQVTIPAEVRRILGTTGCSKVIFEIDGKDVRLRPARYTLETAYGSVKPLHRPEDFDRMSREAREEHADETIRKMREE